jgi:AcrR family transcriptional regulator
MASSGAGPPRQARHVRARDDDLAARILDTALDIAEDEGWAGMRLVDVAARLDIAPNEVLRHYRDLNSVADAWFLRGWAAMLAARSADFAAEPAARRIETCMLAWFDELAAHRRVTVEMLRGKLHLPHPHHWVPMVFDLSRTIHWLREAALLPARYGSRRANMEEVGLTWLFLATLAVWARDDTPGQTRPRRFLRHRLGEADRAMTFIWGAARPAAPCAPTPDSGERVHTSQPST